MNFQMFKLVLGKAGEPEIKLPISAGLLKKQESQASSCLRKGTPLASRKGGVICISEVIDISPGNLDSSLCFIQPSISYDVQFSHLVMSDSL